MEIKSISDRFIEGMNLTIQKLIDRTKKENGYLVVSRDGKIVRLKASDLNDSLKPNFH
jgi:hypothetical protein